MIINLIFSLKNAWRRFILCYREKMLLLLLSVLLPQLLFAVKIVPAMRGVKNLVAGLDKRVQQPEYILTGIVTDSEGVPLKGVTVKLVGHDHRYSVTDARGEYSIRAYRNAKLYVSMLGYKSETILLAGERRIVIKLTLTESAIEDVIITGYTQRTREQFTGAATVITRKDLEKFKNNNIFAIIQSIDPAFKLDENVQNGSNPNVIPQVNIRGISSVGSYAVNAPLVILDGFQVSLSRLYDLDVNRIESISILKDASATSLYGSRGGNGVIVVETRLPKDGKFTISYDAKPTITLVDLSDYNLMNAAEKLDYEKFAGLYQVKKTSEGSYTYLQQEAYDALYASRQRDILAGVDTYWLQKPIKSGTTVAHSLRLEGGKDEVRYSLDGSYNDLKGVMKGSSRKLVSGAFNLIYRIPNKFIFRNEAAYQYTAAYDSPYGSFSDYTRLNPYERVYDEAGKLIVRFADLSANYAYYSFGPNIFNPLYDAELPFKEQRISNVLTNNAYVEWFALPNLRVIARGVITKSFTTNESFTSPYHTRFYGVKELKKRGLYSLSNGEGLQLDGNINVQYSKTFGKHQVIGNVVGEVRSIKSELTGHRLTGFADDRIVSPALALQYAENSLPSISSNPVNSAGAVLSALYTYDNRYNLSANLRWDGSSIYGANNRNKLFWTTGLRYNLHREPWFSNPYVNFLSLYGNVGIAGLENFRGDMALSSYRFSAEGAYFRQNSAIYSSQGNPFIGWPEVQQRALGLEIAFFQNAFKIETSVYNNTTKNMITSITVAPSLGFSGNTYSENLGKVNNKGFEVRSEIRLYQDRSNDFSCVFHVGLVQNRGKLLEISEELRKINAAAVLRDQNGNIIKPSTYYEEGQSLQIIRAVPSLGIDPASGRELFLNKDGNVTYSWNANDQRVVGNREPKLLGNFGTSCLYKRLGLTTIFRYSLGGDVYNQTLMDKIENNDAYFNADRRVLTDRWKQAGDQARFKAIDDLTTTQVSSRFVQRENFLALSSLNLFYELSTAIIHRYKLQRVRLNFSANDMFRLSSVRMERGIDYPYARTYNFGFLIQF